MKNDFIYRRKKVPLLIHESFMQPNVLYYSWDGADYKFRLKSPKELTEMSVIESDHLYRYWRKNLRTEKDIIKRGGEFNHFKYIDPVDILSGYVTIDLYFGYILFSHYITGDGNMEENAKMTLFDSYPSNLRAKEIQDMPFFRL